MDKFSNASDMTTVPSLTSATGVMAQASLTAEASDRTSVNSGKRKVSNDGSQHFPAKKKNRDYLASQSKPIYFDFKKAIKK